MILDIQNVSCRYTSREKDTLTGVNLRIEEGEWCLLQVDPDVENLL